MTKKSFVAYNNTYFVYWCSTSKDYDDTCILQFQRVIKHKGQNGYFNKSGWGLKHGVQNKIAKMF